MDEMLENTEVRALRWHLRIRSLRQQLKALRSLIDGFQALLDAGGPVTRLVLAPKWLLPNVVLIAIPQGARDLLGRTDEVADRGGSGSMVEMRALMGGNLLDRRTSGGYPGDGRCSRCSPSTRCTRYAGHMAAAARGRRRLA